MAREAKNRWNDVIKKKDTELINYNFHIQLIAGNPALFCVCVVVIPRCESGDNFVLRCNIIK